MKSPLRKRLPRELKSEIGKYLVVLILMIATIGFVSGFLVADGSMLKAYNEGFEKYKIEDGNFRIKKKITKSQRENIEKNGVTLYENFYLEEALDNGSTMRIFKNREKINLVCLMEGKLPEKAGEMAIDRMYADNNKISVGDTLKSGSQKWKVTGFVALSDYSCLFQNNNDSMFDAIKFGVSVVTPEEVESLNQDKIQYSYSWVYDKEPKNEKQEKKMSEDLMEALGEEVTLESFVPQYLNQAITFTGDDMGSDRAMIIMLLYMIIVIMAFVFGITISNTIRKEAGVIGTLRASGYTRKELIGHYMALPVIVTLIGAVVGNLWWFFMSSGENHMFKGIFHGQTAVFEKIIVILFGLFAGVFTGCLIGAVAEILNAFPIMFRRIGLKEGTAIVVLMLAAGKFTGVILQFF